MGSCSGKSGYTFSKLSSVCDVKCNFVGELTLGMFLLLLFLLASTDVDTLSISLDGEFYLKDTPNGALNPLGL